jgi:23S rRNA (guanosine2251-2'-O)-methyltransferase
MEALRAGRTFNKIWVASSDGSRLDPTIGRIIAMARDQGIPLVEVPRTVLDKMSSTRIHQGVIAQIASHDYIEIDEMIEQATKKEGDPFLVMLDSLKDSYNLGSVLRIADAAGVDGIIIPRHRSIGLDATVAKASSGAIEYVPVARVTNLSRTIDDLKKKGFWVFGTDASAEMPYDKANYGGPLLLIIGSEGEGVHENILSKCDVTVSVPMEGHVNSLNAAVAAGVIVFEAKRQRKNAGHK